MQLHYSSAKELQMDETDDLMSVTMAADKAGVSRNTMLLAAKNGKIRARRIGRAWFVYGSDIERWARDIYRPDMAFRFPKTKDAGDDT
jgi:excisionase family DNA binding protein